MYKLRHRDEDNPDPRLLQRWWLFRNQILENYQKKI